MRVAWQTPSSSFDRLTADLDSPRICAPGPYQLADSDPYGTYPLADMYPFPRNWTPYNSPKEEILKRFAVECAWKFRSQV